MDKQVFVKVIEYHKESLRKLADAACSCPILSNQAHEELMGQIRAAEEILKRVLIDFEDLK